MDEEDLDLPLTPSGSKATSATSSTTSVSSASSSSSSSSSSTSSSSSASPADSPRLSPVNDVPIEEQITLPEELLPEAIPDPILHAPSPPPPTAPCREPSAPPPPKSTSCPAVIAPSERPYTPNTNKWLASALAGKPPDDVLKDIIFDCSNCPPNSFIRQFTQACSCTPSVAAAYSSSLRHSSYAHHRQEDVLPPAIMHHKDFQELRSLDARHVHRRRDKAERYLKFEVVRPTEALHFDPKQFVASYHREANTILSTSKRSRLHDKRKHSGEGAAVDPVTHSHHHHIPLFQPSKKSIFRSLKDALKNQATSSAVDMLHANPVDFAQAETCLQRAFVLLAESFGLYDKRTQPALDRLKQCYEGQTLDKEEDLRELLDNPTLHMERLRAKLDEIDKGNKPPSTPTASIRMEKKMIHLAKVAKTNLARRVFEDGHDVVLQEAMEKAMSPKDNGLPPVEGWFTSNRLQGSKLLPSMSSTTEEIVACIHRSDYVQVSQHALEQLKKNLFDPPMQSIFRSSIVNIRHFPRVTDFKVTVTLGVPKDVIIGDVLDIRYDYQHKLHKKKPHSTKDWLGVFACADKDEELSPAEDEANLVVWRFVTNPNNKGALPCIHKLEVNRSYRCKYFIASSDCAVSVSPTFWPRFAKAKLFVPTTIYCGHDLSVSYSIDYRHKQHDCEDWIGIFHSTDTPTPANWVQRMYLPRGNSGEAVFKGGVVFPGTYKACLFLATHDDQHIGSSDNFVVGIDAFTDVHYDRLKMRDISVCLVARWDMEMEESVLVERVMPHLKQHCDNFYCSMNLVNLVETVQSRDVMDTTEMRRFLQYLEICHPFFIFCLGDQVGQTVEAAKIDETQINTRHYPWFTKIPRRFNPEPCLTEVMLWACLRVPALIDPSLVHFCHFYFTTLNVRSKRHPALQSKNQVEMTNALNYSRLIMRTLKREILATVPPQSSLEYETVEQLATRIQFRLRDALAEIYSPDEPPSPSDHIAMMMDSQLQNSKKGHTVASVDACRYTPSVKPTGAIQYTAVALPGQGQAAGATGTLSTSMSISTSNAITMSQSLGMSGSQSGPKGLTLTELLNKYLDDTTSDKPVLIVDRAGSGLSTFLSLWLSDLVSHSEILMDSLPQYGPCQSRVLFLLPHKLTLRRLVLYLDLELLSHHLDLPSILYYIMTMVSSCSSTTADPPDPNMDMNLRFTTWLADINAEQVILILDGLDHLPVRDDDLLTWIPYNLTPLVRIIATATPVGQMVYACESPERMWLTIRRRSELTLDDKMAAMDSHLCGVKQGLVKEWVMPIIKSDKTSHYLALKTILEESLDGFAFPSTLPCGLHDAKPDDVPEPDALVMTDYKTKMGELLEAPDVFAIYRATLIKEAKRTHHFKDAVCLIRVAQRGLSELELILALLRLQDLELEIANARKKQAANVPLSSSTTPQSPLQDYWGGDTEIIDHELRLRAAKRKGGVVEPLSKRFNAFRNMSWLPLQASLAKVTNKVLGLYHLKNRLYYRAVDSSFLEHDSVRMQYLSALIDQFVTELPSQRKASHLGLAMYRAAKAAMRLDPSAGMTVAAAAIIPTATLAAKEREILREREKEKEKQKPAVHKVMDKLLEVLTDPALFRHSYHAQHRSAYSELLALTGAKGTDIYARLTSKYETAYKLTAKYLGGPKLYHLSFPPPDPRMAHFPMPTPLSHEGLETLLLMAHFAFYHLKLFDAGQDMAESVLLILLQARSFDTDLIKGEIPSAVMVSSIAPVIMVETVLLLARMYSLRFCAMYESRLVDKTESLLRFPTPNGRDDTGLELLYRELISQAPTKRSRPAAAKAVGELFSLQDAEDNTTGAPASQQQQPEHDLPSQLLQQSQRVKSNSIVDNSSAGPGSDAMNTTALNRQRLSLDAKLIHTRFVVLDQMMEKIGQALDQRAEALNDRVESILRSHYPATYDLWAEMWGRYHNAPIRKSIRREGVLQEFKKLGSSKFLDPSSSSSSPMHGTEESAKLDNLLKQLTSRIGSSDHLELMGTESVRPSPHKPKAVPLSLNVKIHDTIDRPRRASVPPPPLRPSGSLPHDKPGMIVT